jgi:hypothetical protein
VALPVVDRDTFLSVARSAAEHAAVDTDWVALLTAYEWGGSDWRAGLTARGSMHHRMITAGGNEERSRVVAEIVAWGGLVPLPAAAVRQVLVSLAALDALAESGHAPGDEIYAHRIASVSKVYAMYSPSRWVIYDSRVARGLALLALQVFGAGRVPAPLLLPQPVGRTGGPADGFPILGTDRQGRLAFVYASWFAHEVASQISVRCPDPDGWDARHVEMALFMFGNPMRTLVPPTPSSRIDATVQSIDRRLVELSDDRLRLEAARRALVD